MVGQERRIRWHKVPSPVRGGTADKLFSGKSLQSGATPLLRGFSRKNIFVKKYLITSLVFNGVEFNKKSKSELTILWPLVGR
jgi:hypothetical protein